jgi:phage terminase large subunit
VPEAEKWPITADSARPETISHMRRHGFPKIMSAVKGPKSVEEGVEFLKSFDIIVHPRCVHTIDELTLYSFETDPLTGAVMPKLRDKNNNVIDALRYACEGVRRAKRREREQLDARKRGAAAARSDRMDGLKQVHAHEITAMSREEVLRTLAEAEGVPAESRALPS